MEKSARAPVTLHRKIPGIRLGRFTEHFQGFERVEAVRSIFGEKTEQVLGSLRVGFVPLRWMFMGIRDSDGNLTVGTYHLKNSPTRTLYLDVVHELFHINQRMENEKWFHGEFMKFLEDRTLYYASPIEIPAYEHTVREAERIGMEREEIVEYLKMLEAPPKTWRNFLKAMDLKDGPNPAKKVTRFPVTINRDVRPELHPFSDYFRGFEKVDPVREMLGDSTDSIIAGLKVEFIDFPFPFIMPSEEDGHLIVTGEYFRTGKTSSIYLDVLLSLGLLRAFSSWSGRSGEAKLTDNPELLAACTAMVKEARRMGLSDGEIMGHLQMIRFAMPAKAFGGFLRKLKVRPGPAG
ncbi:MAG: hypothetical protein JRN09_04030 [Nitrososphaerota archaeon]|nr:hypothetical protein [Nitrososphaerota archaeon]